MEERLLPPDFDWVSARHNCSVDKFFERLRLGAQSNVERRNALGSPVEGQRFTFTSSGSLFSVARGTSVGVVFRVVGERIYVEGNRIDVKFNGALTLTNEARCLLRVGDRELDEWQVLRLALEALLFPA